MAGLVQEQKGVVANERWLARVVGAAKDAPKGICAGGERVPDDLIRAVATEKLAWVTARAADASANVRRRTDVSSVTR